MAEFIKQSWVFPVLQSVHIIGITLLVGSIALLDFRLLGIGMRRRSVEHLAATLAPWTVVGLLTVLITGPVLFGSDLPRYLANPAFIVKMLLLAMALATHFTLPRHKLSAIVSLILWSSVILAGRAIADFDIRTG